jgi:WD40 repeat protein
LLAVSGSGSGVELWDPATNTLVATVRTPDRVHDVAFSPDGRTLAAASGDVTSVWAIVEPVGRTRLSGFGSRPSALAFGPGEDLALALWGEGLRLWTSGQCPSSAHMLSSPEASSVAFDNQGRLAAVQSDGIDWLDPNSEPLELREHLAMAPDGSSEPRRPLSVLPGLLSGLGNWASALPLPGLNRRGGSSGGRRSSHWTRSASSADGRVLAVVRGPDVYLWRADDPEELTHLTDDPPPVEARRPRPLRGRTHRESRASHDRDQDRSERPRGDRPRRRGPTAWTEVAVSSSGNRVYLASIDGDLAAWQVDGSNRHALAWADSLRGVSALALSPDGRTLAVGVEAGSVFLLNPSDGQVLASIRPESPESGPPASLSISPDGRILAIGDRQGRIALWKLPSSLLQDKPSLLVHLPGHLGSVGLLAFDRDGHHLASADDKIVQVWKLDQVREQLERLGLGW